MYYNGRQTSVLEREEVKTEEAKKVGGYFDDDFGFYSEKVATKKEYVSPTLNFVRVGGYDRAAEVKQKYVSEEEADENITPSKTTMQFVNMEREDVYDSSRDSVREGVKESYRINTKSKIFIALYAIAFVTIFSLVILNAAMLKNVDRTIKNSAEKIEILREENVALGGRLDYLRSDEVIISEAQTRGLN